MFKKIILPSGLRLILVPKKETPAATLLVLFGVGSRYETKKISGISHFVEHLMFKGTTRRPNTLAIAKELDGVGAEYNAFTSKDYTGYYVKADGRHLPLAIEILSDMLVNSKFDEQEIEREKKVIREEINMYEDNPIMYVDDLLEQTMFGNQPLGWLVIGQRQSVTSISRQDVINYYTAYYHPANAVAILSGKISKDALKKIAAKLKLNPAKKLKFKAVKLTQRKPQIKLLNKPSEQLQVAIGFPAYAYGDPKLYALSLLSIILGGNMSSRLFLSVRERQGLCYFIRSSLNTYQDTGGLIIQAGLDKNRIQQAIELILAELTKIKKGVKPEELKRAKEYVFGRTVLDLEDCASLAQFYGSQELLQPEVLTLEQKLAKIAKVTSKEIRQVANEIIVKRKFNLAMIGPYQDKKSLEDLVRSSQI